MNDRFYLNLWVYTCNYLVCVILNGGFKRKMREVTHADMKRPHRHSRLFIEVHNTGVTS